MTDSDDVPGDPGEPLPDPHPDPEIAALLDFAPAVRRNKRRDGWGDDVQRGFIVALVECGSPNRAAYAVGRTMSGAYKVRTAGDGEGFGEAWDKAVDLYLERNPHEPRTGRWRPGQGVGGIAPPPPEPPDPEAEAREAEDMFEAIFVKYMIKLDQEREARLAGRIVEADFYVRQLTWLEVALDLGDNGPKMLMALRRGGHHAGDIVATPVSVLLDRARRMLWQEEGGPERPPPAPLGDHDGEVSTGPPLESQYNAERDGDQAGWRRRREQAEAVAAEAQAAWEEKAKADSAAWRKRVEGEGADGEEAGS